MSEIERVDRDLQEPSVAWVVSWLTRHQMRLELPHPKFAVLRTLRVEVAVAQEDASTAITSPIEQAQ